MVIGTTDTQAGWAFLSRDGKVILVDLARPGTVLAEAPCPLHPGQWYQWEVRYSDTGVRLLVDGNPVLSAALESCGGQMGLYVAGTATAGSQQSYTVFIENCHVHAERIAAALAGAPVPAAPVRHEQPES